MGTLSESFSSVNISKNGYYGIAISPYYGYASYNIDVKILKVSNYGATTSEETLGGFISSINSPQCGTISSNGQNQIIGGYYNGTYNDGKFWFAYSNNSGSTFTTSTSTYYGIPINAATSDNGQYVCISYRNFGSGLFVSSDYGVSYNQVVINPSGNDVECVTMSSTGQYIYVTGNGAIYKSTNYGASFTAISFGGITAEMNGSSNKIRCNNSGSEVNVYVNNVIYKSTDYGVTYSPVINKSGTNFDISIT